MPPDTIPAPERVVIGGRPWWQFPTGELVPVVSGAADDPPEPKPKDPPEPKPDDGDDEPLGDGGKRALDRERKARKDLEAKIKELEPLAAKAKELEDEKKSDVDRANEKVAAAEKRAADAELAAARLEVATEKGLTPAQAKRLVGTTKEELAEDADSSIEDGTFTVSTGGATPPPSRRPKNDLKPGTSDPTEDDDETADPSKLAEAIPRP